MRDRILLIDDDPLVLKSFTSLLLRAGYFVIPASGYEEALKAFTTEDFDLILSDIRIPGKNGVEIVSEMQKMVSKAGKKELPIIFITGYAEDGIQMNASFLGEILTKPIDTDKLLTVIRDYL